MNTETDNDVEEDEIVYKNFTTIDWIRDKMLDRKRQRIIRSKYHQSRGLNYIFLLINFFQGWILLAVIGIAVGVIAAFINVSSSWMTDIKSGFCTTEWYLSRRICCLSSGNTDEYDCEEWHDWSFAMIRISNVYLLKWISYTAISTFFATVCAFIVHYFSPYAAGSGTPEVKTILGGFIIRDFLGLKTLLGKVICLPLTVASGLAVGKEGPMIHVACCVGNLFPLLLPRFWQNEARKREILSAASSAGIAVAFGAPIGGVLFSLEELSTFFPTRTMLKSFFCALVATFTLETIDPYRGKVSLYQVTYSRQWHFFEIPFFIFLGVFGGISGAFFIQLNLKAQKYREMFQEEFGYGKIAEVVYIAMATSLLFYFNTFTRIDGSELLEFLFKECAESDFNGICEVNSFFRNVILLIMALIMRLIFTVITVGIQVPSGTFIPPMIWGALFGRVLGIIIEAFHRNHSTSAFFSSCHPDKPCVTPGMYALLGAMSALGGVTRLTVSLAVIMFELTGTLEYIIPCMITVTVAKIVGDAFGKEGYLDVMIRVNQYPFLDPREDEILGIQAQDAMTPLRRLVTLQNHPTKASEIKTILERNEKEGYPIVLTHSDNYFAGYIRREYLVGALEELEDMSTKIVFFEEGGFSNSKRRVSMSTSGMSFAAYLDKYPITVNLNEPIEYVMDIFKKIGPRYVIVEQKGKLEGIITKKDILKVLYGDEARRKITEARYNHLTDVVTEDFSPTDSVDLTPTR